MKIINLSIIILVLLSACTKINEPTSERFYFRNDGADLAVQVDGNVDSKTFILLLHGGPGGGSAAYNSGYYAEKLEENYAMVYLDQRGNGASQGNYSAADLTLEQNSKDIYALTLFLKQKYGNDISIFLMGHSWGGMTSSHALIHTPIQNELKGWLDIDGAHDFNQNDIEAIKLFLEIGNQQIALNKNVDFWQPIVDEVSLMDTNNITSENQGFLNSKGFEAEGMLEEITNDDPGTEGPPFRILDSPDISINVALSNGAGNPILNEDSQNNPQTSRLHEITIPCLFVWGKYDFVVPPAIGYAAYSLVNTSEKQIYLMDHSGHSPMSNEAVIFTEKLIAFIEMYK